MHGGSIGIESDDPIPGAIELGLVYAASMKRISTGCFPQ